MFLKKKLMVAIKGLHPHLFDFSEHSGVIAILKVLKNLNVLEKIDYYHDKNLMVKQAGF